MLATMIAWCGALFIYNKVAFDLAFYEHMTVLASLIIAVVQSVIIFFITGFYAVKLFKFNGRPGLYEAKLVDVLKLTWWQFLLASILSCVGAKIIIYGFAKRVSGQIDFFKYSGDLDDSGMTFIALCVLPLSIHYILVCAGTLLNTKKTG